MATLSLRHAAVTCSRGPKGMKVWQLPFATPNYLYDDKITIFPMTPERYISLHFRLGRVWGGYPTCHDDDDDPSRSGRWRLTVTLASLKSTGPIGPSIIKGCEQVAGGPLRNDRHNTPRCAQKHLQRLRPVQKILAILHLGSSKDAELPQLVAI